MSKVYYNDEFVEQIETIAKNERQISYELTDFVAGRLEDSTHRLVNYDEKLARKIENKYFTYEEASTKSNIIWTGGGYRTIRRAIQNKCCQKDLFNVIGYYIHKKNWKKRKSFYISYDNDSTLSKPDGEMKTITPNVIDENHIEFTNYMDHQFTIFREGLKADQKEQFEVLKQLLIDQKDSTESLRTLLQNIIQNNEQIKIDIATLQASQNNTSLPDDKQHLTSLWWMLLLAKKGKVVYDLEDYTQKINLKSLTQDDSLSNDFIDRDTIWDWIQKTFF